MEGTRYNLGNDDGWGELVQLGVVFEREQDRARGDPDSVVVPNHHFMK